MKKAYQVTLQGAATVTLLLLFGNVILQVFSRWFLVSVPSWTEEVGNYLLVWLVALSTGVLFLERDPIGIDMIVKRLPPSWKKPLLALNLTLSAAFAFLLALGSWQLVQQGAIMRTPALNLPYSYVYAGLTVTGVVMLIPLIAQLIDLFRTRNGASGTTGEGSRQQ